MKAHPAKPEYSVGDTVRYIDRHGRQQAGVIRRIEASWVSWGSAKPHISYTVEHPTYARGAAHIGPDDIFALV